jgi:hypothetical protein
MDEKNAIILLTACVNPDGMAYTSLQDTNGRIKQYKEALDFYLKNTAYHILIVENTMYDFGVDYALYIASGRLECLTFNGNDFDKSLGKGFGEALIIQYAFNHSVLLKSYSYFIKITGRVIIENIHTLVKYSRLLKDERNIVACNIRPKKKIASAVFFIAKKEFITSYFLPFADEIDDSRNKWFEHVLFDAIMRCKKENYKSVIFPVPIKIKGIAGTTSLDYPKVGFKDYVLSLGASILYNYWGYMKF